VAQQGIHSDSREQPDAAVSAPAAGADRAVPRGDVIRVEGVSKAFGDTHALTECSFTARAG